MRPERTDRMGIVATLEGLLLRVEHLAPEPMSPTEYALKNVIQAILKVMIAEMMPD